MLRLRINPIVVKDLKNIKDYIAEDNEEYAAKTIKEIYDKFENLQMFPGMGSDLSRRVSFRTNYKYAIWEDYVIIYKISSEYVEIYRVTNRYQDITKIFDGCFESLRISRNNLISMGYGTGFLCKNVVNLLIARKS